MTQVRVTEFILHIQWKADVSCHKWLVIYLFILMENLSAQFAKGCKLVYVMN